MKKTLLLFAMLLGVVGAWAQPEVSGAPQDGQWNVNTTWFVITLKGSNSILTTTFTDNENALMIEGQTTTAPGDDALWCVVGDATNGYKFYNKAIGTSKILGITGSEAGARTRMVEDATNGYTTTFDFTQSAVTGGIFWSIKTHGSTNNYFNNRGRYLALWANNSAYGSNGTGSAFLFEEADIEELDIEFTDNTGTIHSGEGKCIKNADGTLNSRFTIAGIPSEWLTNVTTTDNVYKATIDLPFRLSSESKSNKFMMGGHGVGNFKIYADGTNVKVQKNKTPTNSDDINQFLWEIYPTFGDGIIKFNIKNVQAEAYIYSETPKTEHAEGTLSLDQNNKSSFILKKIGEYATFAIDGVNLSINSSNTTSVQSVGLNYYTHGGTNMTFIPYWITYTLTDMAGGVHTGEYEGLSNWQPELPTFTGAEGYRVGEKTWGNGTVSANIDFNLPVSSETVANPTFISTYNYNQQAPDHFKWYASDNKIKVKEDEEIDYSSIASHLWLIYPKFNNGAFTFQIKNVATDLFINSSVSGDGHDDESTVILSNESTEFTEFTIGVRNGEGHEFINSFGKRLSVNTSKPNPADKIQTVGTHGTHPGTALTFPTPEFNVTIGSAGYATLYSPITVRPEDQTLEIYQIESAPENGRIELTQMFHVYKNQGVILKGAEGTYRFGLTEDYWEGFIEDSMWDNNKLKGSFTNTYVQGDAYVLAKPTINDIVQEVGLYKAELNKNANGEAGNTHFKNNAGKAYLPASALSAEAAESRFFLFGFGDGEETGITETENGLVKTENTVVYDLAGRRVQGAQKGIFIVNGKKVVR